MSYQVVIYQLNRKFVNQKEDIPESARQVIYYAIAVGHHVGVMDCFTRLVTLPLEEYQAWLETLPPGVGRDKLEGVIKWGEIEINRSHVELLLPLFEAQLAEVQYHSKPEAAVEAAYWQQPVSQSLRAMLQEPAYYLMIKKVAACDV